MSGFVRVDIDPLAYPDVVCDARNLKFASGSVDVVHSRRCIQHIENDEGVLSEFWRVLKPNGYLFLSVASLIGWLYYKLGLSSSYGRYKVFHLYSKRSIARKVARAGFRVFVAGYSRFDISLVCVKEGK